MDRKYLVYGGGALVLLVGGYFIYSHSVGPAAQAAASNTGDLSTLYPSPTVIGSGSSTSSDSSGTDQLSQLLAAQSTQNQQNYQLGEDTLASNQKIQLATLDTQKAIALDTNQANIEQSLASQLAGIVAQMKTSYGGKYGGGSTGLGEIAGSIGFSNGKISLDLAGSQTTLAGTIKSTQAAVDKVKQGMGQQSVAQAVASVGVGANT